MFKHGSLLLKKNTQELNGVKNRAFDDPQIQRIEPKSSTRKVRLPTLAGDSTMGLIFFIANTSNLYLLNIHTAIAEGENLISVISPKSNITFISDGDEWSSGSDEETLDILQMQIFS